MRRFKMFRPLNHMYRHACARRASSTRYLAAAIIAQLLVSLLASPQAAAVPDCPGDGAACIYHIASDQAFNANSTFPHGAGADFTVGSPQIKTDRTWSIGQLWISAGTDLAKGGWALELGWVKARGLDSVYNDDQPHLLLNVRSSVVGANCRVWSKASRPEFGCGFTPAGDARFGPSDSIEPTDSPQRFHIGYFGGNNAWWIQYQDKWLGWIDAKVLHGATKFDHASWYGEVGSYVSKFPCAEMGNGSFGRDPGSATIGNMFVEKQDSTGSHAIPVMAGTLRTDLPGGTVVWDGVSQSDSISYGGPGYQCGNGGSTPPGGGSAPGGQEPSSGSQPPFYCLGPKPENCGV